MHVLKQLNFLNYKYMHSNANYSQGGVVYIHMALTQPQTLTDLCVVEASRGHEELVGVMKTEPLIVWPEVLQGSLTVCMYLCMYI